jgi:hypothetical protein
VPRKPYLEGIVKKKIDKGKREGERWNEKEDA